MQWMHGPGENNEIPELSYPGGDVGWLETRSQRSWKLECEDISRGKVYEIRDSEISAPPLPSVSHS